MKKQKIKQKLRKDRFEEPVNNINEQVNKLTSLFESALFQGSPYFSKDTKNKMQQALKALQDELRSEIGIRQAKSKKETNPGLIDFKDLNLVINETRKLIQEVIKPLSEGFDLKNSRIQGLSTEIPALKLQVTQRVSAYKNNTTKLSVGERVSIGISTLALAVVGGITELLVRMNAASSAKQKSFRGYPIKSAAGNFAESITMPNQITPQKICIIGPSHSGKTAIFQQLTGKGFSDNYGATVDYDYAELPNAINLYAMSGKFSKVNKIELEFADKILITLDASELENIDAAVGILDKHKKAAEESAPDASIHLVITKIDLIQDKLEEIGLEHGEEKKTEAPEKFQDKISEIAEKAGIDIRLVTFTSAKLKDVKDLKKIILPDQQETPQMSRKP